MLFISLKESPTMKDFEDPPKETARRKAERKWRNRDIEKRFKEERSNANSAPSKSKELEVGDIIKNERPRAGTITRAQTKFAKEIKSMLEAHTKRTVLMYRLSLRSQIHRLKREKLRRLEANAAQQNQGG
jgi:hypothetical protein